MNIHDLVRLKEHFRSDYVGMFSRDERFIYMGDINQMPGHGIFVAMSTGKMHCGLHTYSFETIGEEEA